MARKHFEEEHENHERWLVSYADFITLLFAFFVVMYAISSLNQGKYRVLSDALGSAFGRGPGLPPQIKSDALPMGQLKRQTPAQKQQADAVRRETESLTGIARDIKKALQPLVSQGIVRVSQSSRGVKVEINASILFAPGDANLAEESGQALKAIAEILKSDTHSMQVEGHTDSMPINTPKFPSNWELSGMRAGSVVRLFADNGVAPQRLTAVGHGSNYPAASNETAEGRQRNRRVEIQILANIPEAFSEVPLAERGPSPP
ncbi:MAG: flagellar motor protein MotD [Burkholderiales bacterium]|nr:flagellar motor protein MotD [Burkholderiales bacterium]